MASRRLTKSAFAAIKLSSRRAPSSSSPSILLWRARAICSSTYSLFGNSTNAQLLDGVSADNNVIFTNLSSATFTRAFHFSSPRFFVVSDEEEADRLCDEEKAIFLVVMFFLNKIINLSRQNFLPFTTSILLTELANLP